jgi:hypothetical protein
MPQIYFEWDENLSGFIQTWWMELHQNKIIGWTSATVLNLLDSLNQTLALKLVNK